MIRQLSQFGRRRPDNANGQVGAHATARLSQNQSWNLPTRPPPLGARRYGPPFTQHIQ